MDETSLAADKALSRWGTEGQQGPGLVIAAIKHNPGQVSEPGSCPGDAPSDSVAAP